MRAIAILLVALLWAAPSGADMLIDDFAADDGPSRLGTNWRLVTDGVMGGRSDGHLARRTIDGRPALCLSGTVSLANDGGFIQAALDLASAGTLDAAAWSGIRLLVRGNGEDYNLHLKTTDIQRPWQSYRAGFRAPPQWSEVRLAFADFVPHRTDAPLNLRRLRRLGLVAIGRPVEVELCVAAIGLYRDP
jgi:hypothetical protein